MIWLTAGGLLLLGGAAAVKASRAGLSLETQYTARIRQLTGKHLAVSLDIFLTNPTGGKLRLKHPFILLQVDGSTLGANRISDREIEIPAHTTVRLRDRLGDDLTVLIPFQTAFTVFGPVLGQLLAGSKASVPLTIEVKTTAFLPGIPAGIPYTDTTTIELRKPSINL